MSSSGGMGRTVEYILVNRGIRQLDSMVVYMQTESEARSLSKF
ncbi:hypothetical protein [Nostoc sp.]